MLFFLKALVATPARLAVAASVAAMVVAAGAITFGAWTVTGTGAGYARAVTASVTTNVVSPVTVTGLYPGGPARDVMLSVNNPNAFPITITEVAAGAGAITSDNATCTTGPTGVSFTNTTGLSQLVAAGGTEAFTLSGKATMSSSSVNACQGAIFTIPVTLTATM